MSSKPTELKHLSADQAKDVPISEAPGHPPPLSAPATLSLQVECEDDLVIASVLKKKIETLLSTKVCKKPTKNHRCTAMRLDDNSNEDSPVKITVDVAAAS